MRLDGPGQAVVPEPLPLEIGELAVHPEPAGERVPARIDSAGRGVIRPVEALDRPQADLHPGELVRLLDRIGGGDVADRTGVDRGRAAVARLGVGAARADADELPID